MEPRAGRLQPLHIRALVLVMTTVLVAAGCGAAVVPSGSSDGPTSPASPESAPAQRSAPPSGPAPAATDPSTIAPTPVPAAVLVGAGDIASCSSSGDEATARLLDDIAGTVFTLGDNAYEHGTPSEFERCYEPGWGRHRERTRPVPGNHDYGTAGATAYFDYFGAAAGDPDLGYYAYDLGAWRIYALNSNCSEVGGCGAGSAQERWLRADLEANPRACVAAYWHHPRFSSGSEHGGSTTTRALWQALDDAGAELVLGGHEHSYERFAPQDASGRADPEGIVEIVAGTGGRGLYGFGTPLPTSVVRSDEAYGVVRLELGADGWTSTFVPVAGHSFTDTASGSCR